LESLLSNPDSSFASRLALARKEKALLRNFGWKKLESI